ncbi:MAG: DUF72 domain-containing protein [Candidatus Aenigmarchaeota archaeon]|nr:DUF72 domain-containing protein [Candidatus Aenigmarchaeota archaeon]
MAKVYIGTSGYSYPHWSDGVFYPSGLYQPKWLEFYAENFNTVELNVTFYRLPAKKVFEGWYGRTPKDFLFVVKGSRFITHIKRLKNVEEPISLLFDRALALKEKLGMILWQLPPSLKVDTKRLEQFLKLLKTQSKSRYTFEFRNQSWFTDKIYELLKKYNAALCIADSPSFPKEEVVTADFVYVRFHGGTELYGSNYSDKELSNWAQKIKKWTKQNLDVYCYFNNDAYGYAIQNARTLKDLVKK